MVYSAKIPPTDAGVSIPGARPARRRVRALHWALVLLCATRLPLAAAHMPPPADCACYIASEHGVIADDGLDDTEALRALIRKRFDEQDRYGSPPFIYLSAGTYELSEPIEARRAPGGWSDGWVAGFLLTGRGKDSTILRLADNSPAFSDPAAPAAVLKTGSEGRDDNPYGTGNQGFRHYIMNLTIHTGNNNPGAIGIDYLANNRGAVKNVAIISGDGDGAAGIAMNRAWPGPALIANVCIDGFARGVDIDNHYDYSLTFEHVVLRNQREYGIFVKNNNLFIRGLTSDNAVPALAVGGRHGYVVLLDAALSGAGADAPAILNNGSLLARSLRCAGYDTVIAERADPQRTVVAAGDTTRVAEYVSHEPLSLFDSPARTLNLPVKETPTFCQPDLAAWTSVTARGATPDLDTDDDAGAIQATIDAGGDIVYLPSGAYAVGQTLVVRGGVRLLTGMQSSIAPLDNATVDPLIRFEDGDPEGVILEHLRLGGRIEHAARTPVAIRHCDHRGYANTARGTGDFFVEDVVGKPYRIMYPQHVWMRQVNTEFGEEPLIENHGGTLWILGHKTEGEPTLLRTVNGAVELLGGHYRALKQPHAATPAIIAIDASVSLSFAMEYRTWPLRVREVRDGQTRELRDSPNRIVLYAGAGDDQPIRAPAPRAGAPGRAPAAAALYDCHGRRLPSSPANGAGLAPGVYLLRHRSAVSIYARLP